MFLEKIMAGGKKERKVTDRIREHIRLLCTACSFFMTALEQGEREPMRKVADLEKEGDIIRREIIQEIYEGAFLPYLRPDLCKFVETVDDVFDLLEDTAHHALNLKIPDDLKADCVRVAFLNRRICEMLLISFDAMLKGEDLQEKALAIRIYEKKIDDMKFDLLTDIREMPVENFWEGKTLSDFLSGLTRVSDFIEDASDHLQIIRVSMK